MSDKKFESVQAILEEAGLIHRQQNISAEIQGNHIILNDGIIADSNYNDLVDFEDVTVFCGGEKMEVSNIDAENGVIELANNSKSGEIANVSYNYSNVRQALVEKIRGEVLAEIRKVLAVSTIEQNRDIVGYIVRIYAAGKLLVREYGFNQEITDTSKDGYRKIELAKAEIKALQENEEEKRTENEVWSTGDEDLFGKYRQRRVEGF
uniref:Uncharacterized protein n=1 Tax=Myoviridae sp. ctMnh10 TaxID=2827682 RepID=A0A8S5TIW4_9CAUD|nr:MAG TPA: hypothetical protein [Myoviridae sp. ctMnh10]